MNKPKVEIRKYSDRRLYDTSASRYVKLEDIARMIREGAEVEVRDARTAEDITRVILTQIVMEDARGGEAGGLPISFLRQLVIASDRAIHSGLTEARRAVSSPLEYVRQLVTKDEAAEVERLRQRVEELEARLAEMNAPPRRSRTPAKRRSPA